MARLPSCFTPLLLTLLLGSPAIAKDFEVVLALGVKAPQNLSPGQSLDQGQSLQLEPWGRLMLLETRKCGLLQIIVGEKQHTLRLTQKCSNYTSPKAVAARIQRGESFAERVVQSAAGDARADEILQSLNVYVSNCVFMPRFSEEGVGSQRCPSGFALGGIRCFGHYCDDKVLRCCPYLDGRPDPDTRQIRTSWFSEEPPGSLTYDEFFNGLTCEGHYCDNLFPHAFTSRRLRYIAGCTWTDWFSEEGGGSGSCPDGTFVAGIACSGDFCAQLRLQCCNAQIVP